jgi:hypothetical protein
MQLIDTARLPLIPHAIRRRHHVYERSDTRFRAAARLMQSLWRDSQALDIGTHRTRRGGHRRLGSRLSLRDAAAGRAFLNPSIAAIARHELVYREPGALIAEQRLLANLLSSSGLVFNLFGPLRVDWHRAATILRQLLPEADIASVTHVAFEHSPGRGDRAFTRDKTAFDAAFAYRRSDGGSGLIAMEIKYADDMSDPPGNDLLHYHDLAEAAGLFSVPPAQVFQSAAFSQLAREHLLAQATVINGLYDEAYFILIAPSLNRRATHIAGLYRDQLAAPMAGRVPFSFVELARVIEAYRLTGDDEHASALQARYLNWDEVHSLVQQGLTASITDSGPITESWYNRPAATTRPPQRRARRRTSVVSKAGGS